MAKLTLNIDFGSNSVFAEIIVEANISDCFRCYTEKELMEIWWTGPGFKNKVIKFHPEAGGSYRHLNYNYEGVEVYFFGVYHAVKKDELIIQTFEIEKPDGPQVVSLEKITFEKIDENTTRIVNQSTYQNTSAMAMIIPENMEKGLSQTMNQLEECAKALGEHSK